MTSPQLTEGMMNWDLIAFKSIYWLVIAVCLAALIRTSWMLWITLVKCWFCGHLWDRRGDECERCGAFSDDLKKLARM